MSKKASKHRGLVSRVASALHNPKVFRLAVKILKVVDMLLRITNRLR